MFRGAITALLAICAAGCVLLSTPVSMASSEAAQSSPRLPIDEVEELVGPVALYPDVLLSNVLAAAVFPADVNAAQAMRQAGRDPVTEGDEAWDDSVLFVASFPDVLEMMSQYTEWTTALGETFLMQPNDVLESIQALRVIAWDNGALQTNEQQVVVQEGPTIIIEPASPEVIFVPVYQPSVIFVRQPVAPVLIGFGVGVAVGSIWSNNVHVVWSSGRVVWGPGPWWGRHRTNINVNRNVNVNINTGDRVTRPSRRPGNDGSVWRPDPGRRPPSARPERPQRPSTLPGSVGGSGRSGGGTGLGGESGGRPGASVGADRRPSVDRRAPTGGSGGVRDIPRPTRPPAARPGGTQRPAAPQARPADRPARPTARPAPPTRPPGGGFDRSPQRPAGGTVNRPTQRPAGGNVARPAPPARGSAFQPGAARPDVSRPGAAPARPAPARPAAAPARPAQSRPAAAPARPAGGRSRG